MNNQSQEPSQPRVGVYGRYSTDDQNPMSVDDQFKACNRGLQQRGITPVEVAYESDEGISGEVLSRPGINRLREMIRSRKVDIVIAEEISRFYRDRAEPFKLAGECIDHGVRLIAINDQVDTNTQGWERSLSRAADEHASANDKTSLRIKRAYEGRWQDGFAMGALVPSYKRAVVDAARFDRTHRGPFKDQKDEQWTATIKEMFERVARGDPLRSVAAFLEKQGLPKPWNKRSGAWNDRGVKTLVQNPIFKGQERYRRTFRKKHHASGHHVSEQSRPEEVLFRDMPHLAHVDALLWQQANEAISRRDRARSHPKGADNPSFRIPRESRSPLSNHFFCSVCGGKMIGQGRDGGGYRCGNALRGLCWNRATVSRELTHTVVFRAVEEGLLSFTDAADALVELVQLLLAEKGDVAQKVAELAKQVRVAEQRVGKCGEALLHNVGSEYLSSQLAEAEAHKAELVGQVERLKSQIQKPANPPSRQEILEAIDLTMKKLRDAGSEAGLVLRHLTTPIQATPFKRIDCDLVVLRARFGVYLTALLPSEWQQTIRAAWVDPGKDSGTSTEMTVDLFVNPDSVEFAKDAITLCREGCTGQEISNRLGISRRTAYDAIKLAELMEQRGVDDPYVRLTEVPANASRWGQRQKDTVQEGDHSSD